MVRYVFFRYLGITVCTDQRKNMKGEKKTARKADNKKLSVPFTVEHMEILLRVYDAYSDVAKALAIVVGAEIAYMPCEGAIGQLSLLDNLINALSSLRGTPEGDREEYYDWPLYKVLDNREMDASVRAEKLLSGNV